VAREPEQLALGSILRVALALAVITILGILAGSLLIAGGSARGLAELRPPPPAPIPVDRAGPTAQFRTLPPAANTAAIAIEEHVGRRLPLAVRFSRSDGGSVALGDVLGRGRPALLVLSYSHCALMCSTVLRGAADVARELRAGGDSFAFVNVSIDPRESPAEAARVQAPLLERAGLAGAPEGWPFLVGSRASIDAVADALGFRYAWDARTQQYAHPAALFAIAPDGVVRGYFYGVRFERNAVRTALLGALPKQAPSTEPLTCFRLDTLERRFGTRLAWFFRAGGAATLALGAAGLMALRRAGRQRAP